MLFTKKAQDQIFSSIIEQSKDVIKDELNKRADKLKKIYKSMKYSMTEMLIDDAEVEVDSNMNLNVTIKLNKNIEFEDTDRQNIIMTLERGGAIGKKGVGGHWMRNVLGVKL